MGKAKKRRYRGPDKKVRKISLESDLIPIVERMATYGAPQSLIAHFIGMSTRGFETKLSVEPKLRAAYDKGASKGCTDLLNIAHQRALKCSNSHEARLLMFLVSARCRFAETVKHEVTLNPENVEDAYEMYIKQLRGGKDVSPLMLDKKED